MEDNEQKTSTTTTWIDEESRRQNGAKIDFRKVAFWGVKSGFLSLKSGFLTLSDGLYLSNDYLSNDLLRNPTKHAFLLGKFKNGARATFKIASNQRFFENIIFSKKVPLTTALLTG